MEVEKTKWKEIRVVVQKIVLLHASLHPIPGTVNITEIF